MNVITLNTQDLDPRQNYLLLLGIVIPRPIGFISTISQAGIPNLAPYSYFQAVSSNPPAVIFAPIRDREGRIKHSLRNVLETSEFVASMVTEEMAENMNLASAEFPDGVSEFEAAGFTPWPAHAIKPFLVGESPINLECKVVNILELSQQPLAGAVVVGEVVRIHIREDLYNAEKMQVEISKFRPIARLGGSEYGRLTDTFEMPRPQMTVDGKIIPDSFRKKS